MKKFIVSLTNKPKKFSPVINHMTQNDKSMPESVKSQQLKKIINKIDKGTPDHINNTSWDREQNFMVASSVIEKEKVDECVERRE